MQNHLNTPLNSLSYIQHEWVLYLLFYTNRFNLRKMEQSPEFDSQATTSASSHGDEIIQGIAPLPSEEPQTPGNIWKEEASRGIEAVSLGW